MKRPNRFADVLISFFPLLILAPFHYLGDLLVFSTIRKKLGGEMIACVSGGGSLPAYIDRFFMAAGLYKPGCREFQRPGVCARGSRKDASAGVMTEPDQGGENDGRKERYKAGNR